MIPPVWRKFLGLILLLGFIVIYAIIILALASSQNFQNLFSRGWSQLVFYAFAGLAWVPVAAWIIHWMERK